MVLNLQQDSRLDMVPVPHTDLDQACLAGGIPMHIVTSTPDCSGLLLVMRKDQEARLKGTCFRPANVRAAGNFKFWHTPEDVFSDPFVQRALSHVAREGFEKEALGSYCETFDYGMAVGWESTAPLSDFDKEELEAFQPKRNWWGQRVKTTLPHLEAPTTSRFTVRFFLERQRNEPTVVIQSLYPGVGIGALRGDMTEQTGRVFYDFDHPGEYWFE